MHSFFFLFKTWNAAKSAPRNIYSLLKLANTFKTYAQMCYRACVGTSRSDFYLVSCDTNALVPFLFVFNCLCIVTLFMSFGTSFFLYIQKLNKTSLQFTPTPHSQMNFMLLKTLYFNSILRPPKLRPISSAPLVVLLPRLYCSNYQTGIWQLAVINGQMALYKILSWIYFSTSNQSISAFNTPAKWPCYLQFNEIPMIEI